jgi:hypothetical protein
MRFLLISSAAILGIAWGGVVPATAAPVPLHIVDYGNVQVTAVEKIAYWRRQYRRAYRWGYPAPYAYYPPAYGYYAPPPAYAYPPPVYGYRPPPPAYAYSPAPVYGNQAPPPAADGNYPSADYGEPPPAEGDYPPADGNYGEYPENGY